MTQMDGNISLGQYLRQEREKRGMTIEQVASATKIGVRQLHALESDQYAELPAKPFIRGFVTSYSRFIGLNPKEVLTHFNSFIDSKVIERPNRESGHSGYAFEKREGNDRSRMILSIVMGSFIVFGGIALVVLKPSLHRHKHSHSDKLRAAHSGTPLPSASAEAVALVGPVPPLVSPSPLLSPSPTSQPSVVGTVVASTPTPTPTPAPIVSAAPSPSASPVVAAAAKPTPSPTSAADPLNSGLGLKPSEIKHRLVIKANESVWVRYQVDDKVMMRFPLRKGKILVLRARESIVLQLSDPTNAVVSYNGQGYKVAKSMNSVVRQGDPTYFYPPQLSEKIENPFPGSKPITGISVPASPAPLPSPTGT